MAKQVVATFNLHYLGHRIIYKNLEVGNTTQQLLSTKRVLSLLNHFFFFFESLLSHIL